MSYYVSMHSSLYHVIICQYKEWFKDKRTDFLALLKCVECFVITVFLETNSLLTKTNTKWINYKKLINSVHNYCLYNSGILKSQCVYMLYKQLHSVWLDSRLNPYPIHTQHILIDTTGFNCITLTTMICHWSHSVWIHVYYTNRYTIDNCNILARGLRSVQTDELPKDKLVNSLLWSMFDNVRLNWTSLNTWVTENYVLPFLIPVDVNIMYPENNHLMGCSDW